ncbi:MAG: hypothetical protein CML55_08620 [Rhodobacteraceae bacterium]|nr:hypothetical protein [Paracoccaceae bacterium]MBO27459.1 hypothetical protein [Paracoccaceae bacterium]
MSLPDRRAILLLPLAFAACGFQPVYGPGGNGMALQNRVLVDDPENRFDYILTRELETRLGRARSPSYGLALTTIVTEEGLNIDTTGNIKRYDLIGAVDYVLRDLSDGRAVVTGRVENFTGYSTTGTTVATLAAEQDAQKRLMVILADQIVTRLYAADLSS